MPCVGHVAASEGGTDPAGPLVDDNKVDDGVLAVLDLGLEEQPAIGYRPDGVVLSFKIFFEMFARIIHGLDRLSRTIPAPARSPAIAAVGMAAAHVPMPGPCGCGKNVQ